MVPVGLLPEGRNEPCGRWPLLVPGSWVLPEAAVSLSEQTRRHAALLPASQGWRPAGQQSIHQGSGELKSVPAGLRLTLNRWHVQLAQTCGCQQMLLCSALLPI